MAQAASVAGMHDLGEVGRGLHDFFELRDVVHLHLVRVVAVPAVLVDQVERLDDSLDGCVERLVKRKDEAAIAGLGVLLVAFLENVLDALDDHGLLVGRQLGNGGRNGGELREARHREELRIFVGKGSPIAGLTRYCLRAHQNFGPQPKCENRGQYNR